MAETIDRDSLPRATLTPGRRARISVIWLIPMVAAIVAIGIAIHRILNEGPAIDIVFRSAEGVEAGKTFIKYKDVKIGQVTSVKLCEDYSKVMVSARINKDAEGLMVEDAKFWLVEPRVTLSGISGLGTLISGNYIGFERGKSQQTRRGFIGLEVAPVITIDQPGRQFRLTAEDLGSVEIGSPIYFRHLNVGQVIAHDLNADGTAIQIKVFVKAPYDQYVTSETRFWNASGVDISLGAEGLDVRTQSLVALLIGGLAFETPLFAPPAKPAAADTSFSLYSDRSVAMKKPRSISRRYLFYSKETLHGLSKGAPVTLLGLPAGEVTEVGLDIDPKTQGLRGRIEIAALPEELVARLRGSQVAIGKAISDNEERSHAYFKRMIEEQGLRAQLRSGNLLTGQLYLAFDFFPDAAKVEVDWSREIPVLPLVPSVIPDLETKLSDILAKIDALPFKSIGADIKATLETLNRTLKGIDKTVDHVDTGLMPGLKSAVSEFKRTLASANRVFKNVDATLVGKDAPGQQELSDALREVARTARSLRVLTDYLERHPEALVRGKARNP